MMNQHTVSVYPIERHTFPVGFTCKRFRMAFIASFALKKKVACVFFSL